jgi:integrase
VTVEFSEVVGRGENRVRKDTKTHQSRDVAISPFTCTLIAQFTGEARDRLKAVGLELADDAYLFSLDPLHKTSWLPGTVSHWVADTASAAGVKLNIKGLRHYTASQLLAAGFDTANTAARLGHGGGAVTLRHYAHPVESGPTQQSQLQALNARKRTRRGLGGYWVNGWGWCGFLRQSCGCGPSVGGVRPGS